MNIELQPAYVLHTRAYRDTSLIVDLLTCDHGRLSVVSRGAKRRKGGVRQLLNPFTPLLISCQGKSSLKTLTAVESQAAIFLSGKFLLSGFYLNELLTRLLPELDPQPEVFELYRDVIVALADGQPLEPSLRHFEFSLLGLLGYDLVFDAEIDSGKPIQVGEHYCYVPEQGFRDCRRDNQLARLYPVFPGEILLSMGRGDFSDGAVKSAAKKLARLALSPLLGDKPLKARELFKPAG